MFSAMAILALEEWGWLLHGGRGEYRVQDWPSGGVWISCWGTSQQHNLSDFEDICFLLNFPYCAPYILLWFIIQSSIYYLSISPHLHFIVTQPQTQHLLGSPPFLFIISYLHLPTCPLKQLAQPQFPASHATVITSSHTWVSCPPGSVKTVNRAVQPVQCCH